MFRGLVAACVAAVLAGAAPAETASAERNGELAYHGRASARGVLYVQAADGAGVRRLRAPGRPADPAFSPLGRRIAFGSSGAIWVMNAEGTDVRRLTPPGLLSREPAWSPDGAAIAFSAGPRGARDLYRIGLDGNALRQITSGRADDEAPSWSANGIAFVRRGRNGDGDLYRVGPGGRRQRRLTRGHADDGSPAWSPGGNRIAFTRALPPVSKPRSREHRRRARKEPSARRRALQRPQLTVLSTRPRDAPARLTAQRYGVTSPTWSPDNRQIAFGAGLPGRRALYRLRVRERRIVRVTSGSTDVRSVSWQPEVDEWVVAAAGDIACDPADRAFAGTRTRCHMRQTSDLLLKMELSAALVLGDVQYEDGQLWKYAQSFHPTWGRLKALLRPTLGNHEYGVTDAAGYFDYFNGPRQPSGPAGPRPNGYYSFDVGAWHVVALNSQCTHPSRTPGAPGCEAGSEQEQWLRADLAAHPQACTLAFWHHPLISSRVGIDDSIRPLWQALYDNGVDVVLTAHDHSYERFAPLDAAGIRDPTRGIRQFVVGTGGRNHHSSTQTLPNSEVRDERTFGVLQLRLRPWGYYWTFVPEARRPFTDNGANACH
jgi:calcineurin-like phosphoesterase family protein/WD40 repeat protein